MSTTNLQGRRMPSHIAVVPKGSRLLDKRIRAAYVRAHRRYTRTIEVEDSDYGKYEMPRWDGGQTNMGTNHTAVWPRISEFLKKHNCMNIERFVFVQFEDQIPYPNTFYIDTAWERYKLRYAAIDIEIASRLRAESKVFRDKIIDIGQICPKKTTLERWVFVLLDKLSGLSPLIRYCVALSEGLDDIATAYYNAAMDQLLTDPLGYQKHWAAVLPVAFRRDVFDLLEEVGDLQPALKATK